MGETQKPSEEDYNADDGRRSFLKKMGYIIGGTATVGATGYALKEHGENIEEKKIAEIRNGETVEQNVPKGYGIDHFYARSGWNEGEGSVNSDTYRKAVMQLNNLESTSLQEGQKINVPVREGQSLKGGE